MSATDVVPDTSATRDVKLKPAVAQEPMLAFFLSALEVRAQWLADRVQKEEAHKTKLDEILKSLRSFPKDPNPNPLLWNDAYSLERQIALLEPTASLYSEVRRRVDKASYDGVPAADRLKKAAELAKIDFFDDKDPTKYRNDDDTPARLLLLDILEETHWTSQKRSQVKPLQTQAISRSSWGGVIAFALFIAPYVYLYVISSLYQAPPFLNWPWLPLWSAASAGLFGAFFSRMTSLQTAVATLSLSVIGEAQSVGSLVLRGVVGICGAMIVFFLLSSGLISGNIFPKFEHLGITNVPWPGDKGEQNLPWNILIPDKDMALLIVWSFLAGFSERFVPNILASTEKTLSDAAAKK